MRLGDTVDITLTVRASGVGLMDPTTLTAKLRDGKNVDVASYEYPGSAEITRASLGVFVLRVVLDTAANPGTWKVASRAAGAVYGTGLNEFEVRSEWS